MTAEKAVEIAQTCGAFDPPFHGKVTFEIKEGTVKEVAVLQTFRETQTN